MKIHEYQVGNIAKIMLSMVAVTCAWKRILSNTTVMTIPRLRVILLPIPCFTRSVYSHNTSTRYMYANIIYNNKEVENLN